MLKLIENHLFLLLLIIIIGYMIGKIRIGSFSLGASTIIFVALVFGHFGKTLPKEFQTLGLVLFIYSIALQAGPGFIASFRQGGLKLSLGALVVVAVGFMITLISAWLFKFGSGFAAGLFAGSLTSTPGLAVAVELTRDGGAPAAYGVTYVFGVIGVILFVKLLPKIIKIDIEREEMDFQKEIRQSLPPVIFNHFEVTNPNLFDKAVKDIYLNKIASVSITRLLRAGASKPELVNGDTILKEGDHLRIAGLEDDLEKVSLLIGKRVKGEIEFNSSLSMRKIIVTKKEMIGETLGGLNLRRVYNTQVGHISRSGFDLPVDPHLRLNKGDVLHAVGQPESLDNVEKLLGNNVEELYTASVFSILVGIFLGFLAGKIPLTIPGAGEFTLGTTGGVLLVGLLLSHLRKTGPFMWEIPPTANSFIRQLGLLIFLATVGASAGTTFVHTVKQHGIPLFVSGILVTLVPLTVSYMVCRFILKIRFLRILGIITGGMTSTPGLAAATSISDTRYAATAFATVYPMALVGMILFTKLMVWILHLKLW